MTEIGFWLLGAAFGICMGWGAHVTLVKSRRLGRMLEE